MQSIDLIVDTRETKVISEITFPFSTEQLEIGDFIFRQNDNPILLIERKTWSDLDSSIKNNRHKQQRHRMQLFRNMYNGCKCGYIIEGNVSNISNCTRGAIENMALYYNFFILPSSSPSCTAQILDSLSKKLAKNADVSNTIKDFEDSMHYNTAESLSKKSQISNSIFYHQLLVIPHVGEKLAKSLIQRFSSVVQFCQWINEQNDPILSLSQFKLTDEKRKLGIKNAKRIVDAFTHGYLLK